MTAFEEDIATQFVYNEIAKEQISLSVLGGVAGVEKEFIECLFFPWLQDERNRVAMMFEEEMDKLKGVNLYGSTM